MTAADLIAELGKFPPNQQVRVCTRTAISADESGEWEWSLHEGDAQEADEVRNEGAFVLIWGGKP